MPDAIDALAGLVEQSLVVRDDSGPVPRYRMLETVRELASDQLRASGEEHFARSAHLRYLLRLARENDLERLDAEVGARLDRLKTEEANLLAGIEWGIEHDAEAAVEVLAELDWFWFLADRPSIGRQLHERALATDVGPDLRAVFVFCNRRPGLPAPLAISRPWGRSRTRRGTSQCRSAMPGRSRTPGCTRATLP